MCESEVYVSVRAEEWIVSMTKQIAEVEVLMMSEGSEADGRGGHEC